MENGEEIEPQRTKKNTAKVNQFVGERILY